MNTFIRTVSLAAIADGNKLLESAIDRIGLSEEEIAYLVEFDYHPGREARELEPPDQEEAEYIHGIEDGMLYLTTYLADRLRRAYREFADQVFSEFVQEFRKHEVEYFRSPEFYDDVKRAVEDERLNYLLMAMKDDLNFSCCA